MLQDRCLRLHFELLFSLSLLRGCEGAAWSAGVVDRSGLSGASGVRSPPALKTYLGLIT